MNEDTTTGKDMGVITGGSKRASKKPWLKIVLLLAVLVVAGVAVWWFMNQKGSYLDISHLNSDNVRVKQAQDLAKKSVPQDAKERAVYYATIATDLQAGDENIYAEHFLLTAQKVADENDLDLKDYRYYVGLIDIYQALHDDAKAEEYTQKEQKFLEANYSKEVLDQMKEAKPDEPR
jgi:flagellar basal body-associated protein FliL